MSNSNSNAKNSKSKKDLNNSTRRVSFFFILILTCLAVVAVISPQNKLEEVPLSDVIARANTKDSDISKITVSGSELKITLKNDDFLPVSRFLEKTPLAPCMTKG